MWVNSQGVGGKWITLHYGFSETTLANFNYFVIDLEGVMTQAPDIFASVVFGVFDNPEYFLTGTMQTLNKSFKGFTCIISLVYLKKRD